MCWRDTDPNYNAFAEMEETHRRLRLQQRPAHPGDKVHIDIKNNGARYFRRQTLRFNMGMPWDTIELVFQAETEVLFTELPDEVRKEFGLSAGNHRALLKVTDSNHRFYFDGHPDKFYEPLLTEDRIRFEILDSI